MVDLASIREDYAKAQLNESSVGQDPIAFFQEWMHEAVVSEALEPTAMVLSTIDSKGFPDSRVVLLKGVENQSFLFFTNYHSAKGKDLAARPFAALNFFWPELQRQVRIRGFVERVAERLSESYFATRPYGSQIGAWVSEQSNVIQSREILEKNEAFYQKQFPSIVPKPPHWGGFKLNPQSIEFWQGRTSRLHDRIRFNLENNNWIVNRLAP